MVQLTKRPAVCIGTDENHTSSELGEQAADAFEPVTSDIGRNSPFEGTYVPTRHYLSDHRVHSVMVEI
ncbi:MAG: N-formylglutamate amidohydrolase [Ilumatobacteraceae bacterium]